MLCVLFPTGFTKKVESLAKQRGCDVVRPWIRSMSNHMYWAAATSQSGAECVAKWRSLGNHIQDLHDHEDPLFPKCLHEPSTKEWLKPCK